MTTVTCNIAGSVTATAVTVSSAVGAASGGTGQTSLTSNNALLGNGTSALQFVAPGSSGNVLTSNGSTWVSSAAPSTASWTSLGGGVYSGSSNSTQTFNTVAVSGLGLNDMIYITITTSKNAGSASNDLLVGGVSIQTWTSSGTGAVQTMNLLLSRDPFNSGFVMFTNIPSFASSFQARGSTNCSITWTGSFNISGTYSGNNGSGGETAYWVWKVYKI